VTNWFGSPHSTCWHTKSQGKLSRCPIRYHYWNFSIADPWIRQPTSPLLTHKQSRKTESLSTQKSSPKLFQELTNGMISTHSPCWLRKRQGKLSPYPLRNSPRNLFHKWGMDLSAHTAPIDLEIVKENWVASHSKIASKTAFRGDAWIPQCTEPLLTHKQSRKTESLPSQK